jgi:pectate lyase
LPSTLLNVWWQDVCEDAVCVIPLLDADFMLSASYRTLKQPNGTSYIIGGGAFHAADKIVQFNGYGNVSIVNFYASDYGKLVRSCGNCRGNGAPRNIIVENVVAVSGGVLCGININFGDTCNITKSCQDRGRSCDRFTGNSNGAEPRKIGAGPDGTYCKVSDLSTSC